MKNSTFVFYNIEEDQIELMSYNLFISQGYVFNPDPNLYFLGIL